MHEGDLEALRERLARLERENRRVRRTGAVVLAGLAAVVLLGQAAPGNVGRTVEAEQFVLRSADGKVRAVLHTRADGSPHLDFRDAAGNARASLGMLGDVAGLSLTEAAGNGGVILHTQADGRPSLTFTDRNGGRRMTLFLTHDGSSTLAFSDRHRASRMVLNAIDNGPMGLFFYDGGGRLRSLLDVEPDGSPALALFDENRTSRAILGHTQLEGGKAGKIEKRQASSLLLFDRAGRVIWRAP
ncbi:MAG TPA: hypothetical protein VIG69_00825 [Candidatus Methylomirabilis sp.]|jgi:hypothetical protein